MWCLFFLEYGKCELAVLHAQRVFTPVDDCVPGLGIFSNVFNFCGGLFSMKCFSRPTSVAMLDS